MAEGRQRGHVDHGAQLGPPALGDRRPSSVLAAFPVSRAAGRPASPTAGHAGICRTGQISAISPAMVIHPIPGSVARYVASSNASRKVWSSPATCASWSPTKSMRSTSRVTSRMAASCPWGAATVPPAFSQTCSILKRHIRRPRRCACTTPYKIGLRQVGNSLRRQACQGRSKIRPPWRRKTRPFGSWVEWRNAAVRRGRQDAGVAAGWRAFLLCSRRELSPFSSRMWTWWVSRSSSAPVSRSDPKISVHSLKGRFEVTSVDACS